MPPDPAEAFIKLFREEFKDVNGVEFQRRIRSESEKDIMKEMRELY